MLDQKVLSGEPIDVSRLIDGQKVGWFAVVLIFSTWLVMLTDGYELSALAFAAPALIKAWHVSVAPTVLFFGRNGREVAERLTGGDSDFYGAYLEARLQQARTAVRGCRYAWRNRTGFPQEQSPSLVHDRP